MTLVIDLLALGFVLVGLFFMFVGAVGVGQLPDVYNRLHAASKCSTLGLLGLLLGAVFHIATIGIAAKAVMIVLFAFVATPVGSHMLAKAALRTATPTWRGTRRDINPETPETSASSQPQMNADQHG